VSLLFQADCHITTFILKYAYRACEPGAKEQFVDMAVNSSSIKDTSCAPKSVKTRQLSTKEKGGIVNQYKPKHRYLYANGAKSG
jgi:transposase-like protein